jgi:hypothetical protein
MFDERDGVTPVQASRQFAVQQTLMKRRKLMVEMLAHVGAPYCCKPLIPSIFFKLASLAWLASTPQHQIRSRRAGLLHQGVAHRGEPTTLRNSSKGNSVHGPLLTRAAVAG